MNTEDKNLTKRNLKIAIDYFEEMMQSVHSTADLSREKVLDDVMPVYTNEITGVMFMAFMEGYRIRGQIVIEHVRKNIDKQKKKEKEESLIKVVSHI